MSTEKSTGGFGWVIFSIGLSILIALAVSGCTTTVAPKPITDTQASFDGNEQNSGLLGQDSFGFELITPHARDRYNALVAIYGGYSTPPLSPDDGLSQVNGETNWRMDKQHFHKFGTMNRWKKEGKPPKPPPN